MVTGSSVFYQASKHYPGLLEKIDPDGSIVISKIENG